MSTSLLDLIKEYGKAEADWAAGSVDYVPSLALAKVEERIEAIRSLAKKIKTEIDPSCSCTDCTSARLIVVLLDRGTT